MSKLDELSARIDDLVYSTDYRVRQEAVSYLKSEVGKILLELNDAREEHMRLLDIKHRRK